MVLSNDDTDLDDAHPYHYARVLGIYHALVSYSGRSPVRVDFLHVRWFRRDRSIPSGWLAKRLPCLSFVPHTEQHAFGFLDPADVVRAVHLMPAFAHKRVVTLPAPSPIAHVLKDGHSDSKDWRKYYLGMYVGSCISTVFGDLTLLCYQLCRSRHVYALSRWWSRPSRSMGIP